MSDILLVKAHVRDLLTSADWEMNHHRAWLEATPANIHLRDRGHSRGVLLADIKPIVDERKMAS